VVGEQIFLFLAIDDALIGPAKSCQFAGNSQPQFWQPMNFSRWAIEICGVVA
jgi:hypothetical protein